MNSPTYFYTEYCLGTEFIYYFYDSIVCVRSNQNILVEWLDS